MTPVVDGLQQEYGDRLDFRVFHDTGADSMATTLANGQGVSAVPTMMLVSSGGAEVERWIGVTQADALRGSFEAALGP